jgi:hypothetical protein
MLRVHRRALIASAAFMVLGATAPSTSLAQTSKTARAVADDSCTGVAVSGGGTALQNAVKSKGRGTTFCVAPGTYTVDAAGLVLENGDTIDGAGVASPGRPGGTRPSVVIKGAGTTVLSGGSNVTIQDVDITDRATNTTCSDAPSCGQMLDPGDRWTVRRSWLHDADAQCIGSPGPALLVEGSELSGCGTRFDGNKNNGFAAAIKAIQGYTIVDSYVHDNNQGVWCDRDCIDAVVPFTVRNNLIVDNCSFGIHYEYTYFNKSTSASAVIDGNVVKGNAWCKLTNKADIGIVSAQNAKVTNNQVGATPAHPAKGLGIHAFDRGKGAATGSASGNVLNGDTIKCNSPFVCSNNN